MLQLNPTASKACVTKTAQSQLGDGMDVYKTREFARLARKAGIADLQLCEAVARAERGLIDGNYGSELIKQRVARTNQGRSGGHRTVLLHRRGRRAIFIHVFDKKDQSDLTADEKRIYREAAGAFARLCVEAIEALIKQAKWIEIDYAQYQK
jgi:hypothetical protein